MLSPISPVSSRPASHKAQATRSMHPIRKTPSVDQVRFSGTSQEPAKAPGWFKKYGWPTVGIVTGSTIAALGIPLHIIPVVGNAVGLGMNIVGGLIAAIGIYKVFQAMNSNKSAAATGIAQQSNATRGRNSGGLGGNGFLGNMAAGAALGIGSEAVHTGADMFRNRNNDEADEQESDAGGDDGGDGGD